MLPRNLITIVLAELHSLLLNYTLIIILCLFQWCCSNILLSGTSDDTRGYEIFRHINRALENMEKMIWDNLHPCLLFNMLKIHYLLQTPISSMERHLIIWQTRTYLTVYGSRELLR